MNSQSPGGLINSVKLKSTSVLFRTKSNRKRSARPNLNIPRPDSGRIRAGSSRMGRRRSRRTAVLKREKNIWRAKTTLSRIGTPYPRESCLEFGWMFRRRCCRNKRFLGPHYIDSKGFFSVIGGISWPCCSWNVCRISGRWRVMQRIVWGGVSKIGGV